MRILPEPAHFKKADYRKFLRSHPHAEDLLAESYRDDEGDEISLVKESGGEVLVYVGLLSEKQRRTLGDAALRTLNHHLPKEGVNWKILLFGLLFLAIIGGGAFIFLRIQGFQIVGTTIENWLKKTQTSSVSPTALPEVSSTPMPAAKAVPRKTPSPRPTGIPTATPSPRPTASPTASPTATPSPTPTKPAPTPPTIQTIALQAVSGNYIHPDAENAYYVRRGERVDFRVELEGDGNGYEIEILPIRGEADGLSYVFPSAEKDLVTVKIVHLSTGKVVAQEVVTIKRFGSQN